VSASSTPVSEALVRYLAERTRGEDAFLGELKIAAESAGIPPIWISPEQASFMQVLLKAAGAREVVEVGTLAGYSAIVMARALPPDGRVRTVEVQPEHAEFARAWVERSDARGRVEVHLGPGAEVLPTFEDDSADAAFIDADKVNYPTYLDECVRIVRPGGLILCDNAFAFGNLLDEGCDDPSVHAIRAFNDHVAARPGLHGIIAAVGDGCWVCVNEK
jgi:predicted O-methyltransferase YrrM